ncbi:hypothetical protein PVK06_020730 [Gossypium arboreum]|uniref:Uncharacterized protein n=1 Tax=Gossypium arboreum TaxID=29729 RepID=A0ABR0PN52_GOSAR|nr:hypothetical protein PVK06_020730 [Gossypium arboreum]
MSCKRSKTSAENPIVIQDETHDLERLVENVHELNPTEPSELIEPKIDESSNKSKMETNSVTKIREVESEEELNNPEPIKEPEVFEPREEPNVDDPVEPSVDHELTIPMPTFSNTHLHCLGVSCFPGAGGRGVAALWPISKGELLLKVPKSALITTDSLLSRDETSSLALKSHPSHSSTQGLDLGYWDCKFTVFMLLWVFLFRFFFMLDSFNLDCYAHFTRMQLEQTAALKYLYGWLRHHPEYGTLAPLELGNSLYYAYALDLKPNYVRAWANMGISYANQVCYLLHRSLIVLTFMKRELHFLL